MSFIQKITPLQLLMVLAFFSILILVLLLPKTKNVEKPVISFNAIDTAISVDINFYRQQNPKVDSIFKIFSEKKISIDSLIHNFNKNGYPFLSAYFEEIKYLNSPLDTVWYYLGKNYYHALGFIQSSSEAQPLMSSAARCFNKALVFNKKNTNARIMLASCYVQSQSPMLGVQMLKEIEKTDSNNVLLQMQFAEFSLRSNQLDKAIERYQKSLKLDSNKIEIYAYLSEIYLQKKDTLQSIHFLRKFAAKISDTTLKNSINQYIDKLNNHNH